MRSFLASCRTMPQVFIKFFFHQVQLSRIRAAYALTQTSALERPQV